MPTFDPNYIIICNTGKESIGTNIVVIKKEFFSSGTSEWSLPAAVSSNCSAMLMLYGLQGPNCKLVALVTSCRHIPEAII